jgi:flagellar motor switch protein FliN/FliY
MTTSQSAESNRNTFSSAFFNSLIAAISEAGGTPWVVAAVPDDVSTAEEAEPVRIDLSLDGSLRGEMQLEFRRVEAAMLAAKCLGRPTGDYGDEESGAVLKFVQAGATEFCSAVAEDHGTFTIAAMTAAKPASNQSNVAEVTAADEAGNRIFIRMYLNPALIKALSPPAKPAGGIEVPANPFENMEASDPQTSEAPMTDEQIALGAALVAQFNLKLVMDVELNVTLRFGQRQLALREVMELTSGSVIELDRQVDEPVELLLEGKVIARGEAVVIDGNYGLRVTEVPQPISSVVPR